MGEFYKGVYHLKKTHSYGMIAEVTQQSDTRLLHEHLSHPSTLIDFPLSEQISKSCNFNDCDACHRAKDTCPLFGISSNIVVVL